MNKMKIASASILSSLLFLALIIGIKYQDVFPSTNNTNTAAVASVSTRPVTLGITVPQKEVKTGERIPFNIILKNASSNTQTLKNYVASYTVLDEAGTTVYTSQPVEKGASLILKVGQSHTISPAFYAPIPLAPGIYTIRALMTATSRVDMVAQNKVTVTGPTRLPPIKGTGTPSTTPPVVSPATTTPPEDVPPATTTPPVELPPVSSGNSFTLSATDKASYKILENKLFSYAEQAKSANDKLLLSVFAETVQDINLNTSDADWNSTDITRRPNNVYIDFMEVSGDASVLAKKESIIASVISSIRRLFTGLDVSTQRWWMMYGITSENNKCIRYDQVFDEQRDSWILTEAPDDFLYYPKFKSLFITPKKIDSIDAFPRGICSFISVFNTLRSFDVAAASGDIDFKIHQSASPYDNSAYYEYRKNGKIYKNRKVLNEIVKRAQVNQGEIGPDFFQTARAHSAFNEYGPADFECQIIDFDEEGYIKTLEANLKSCDIAATLHLGREGGGHAEMIKKVTIGKDSDIIQTVDNFKQGSLGVINGKTARYLNDLLVHPENTYVLTKEKTNDIPQLKSYQGVGESFVKSKYLNKLTDASALLCRDKSDVRRNLDNMDWVLLENQKADELADFIAKTNAKYWLEWEKETNPWYDPNDALDFSACKKVDVGAALKTYKAKLREWTIKWNKAAYDNRGYLTKAKREELTNERYWGAPGYGSGSEHKKGFEGVLFEAVYQYSNCVNDNDRQLSDEIWDRHPEIGKFYDDWDNKGKTYYTPEIDKIKKTIKCETLLK